MESYFIDAHPVDTNDTTKITVARNEQDRIKYILFDCCCSLKRWIMEYTLEATST
jgi:hypothetical protein